MDLPTRPLLFAKWLTSLIAPGEPIVLPAISQQVDYEAELGVVIGQRTRGVAAEAALDAVESYLCVNDVSARDIQLPDGQWSRGKSFDTFCPVGQPVPASEVPDPQALGIRCRVNGELLQDSNTSEMVFSVAEIIAFVSEAITLEPGDLIATGTPAGVGMARTPQVWLTPGDEVTIEIDGLPSLTNPVLAEGA
jgi:2-keto-4-pentenoate hydratase/2-oxohepta-3-ene-1,7-dioic acid hydratase in catechol pathway